MRRADGAWLALGGGLLLAGALPVVAQSGPESLLPPGFGQPEDAQPAGPPPGAPGRPPPAPGQPAPQGPESVLPPGVTLALPSDEEVQNAAAAAEADADPAKYDLPADAHRSLDQIGVLTATTGGVSPDAYGRVRGHFLAGLMRASNAPFVSRWASILLRRVLLSGTTTPDDINGADLAAERAALLLRMGEADAARMIVQSVDTNNYTPRLYDVAMQTYLATADPAGFCPIADAAFAATGDARWQMAQAICASFAGDQGIATSMLNLAQRKGKLRGVDYRLGEKTVGAGPNSRRSVKIEWSGVDALTPWRFGLATATNVEIPDALYATGGDAMRAWEARAPTLSLERRLAGVSTAARLGIFSGDALIGYYAKLGGPDIDGAPADLYENFRDAYAGETVGARVKAMRDFWKKTPADGSPRGPGDVAYGALPALARAAAALPPSAEVGADMPWLIAAMLASGYDRNAARWLHAVEAADGEGKARAWGLLAVGLPDTTAGISRTNIDAFVKADASDKKIASQMLVAALSGLGRLNAEDAATLSSDLGVGLSVRSRWARALAAAAARREKGTVVLLAAVGLQARSWANLPPAHLAAVLTALRSIGLEPEARMIAAEAVTRL